eukprot:6477215-Amphidinium_carterae.1
MMRCRCDGIACETPKWTIEEESGRALLASVLHCTLLWQDVVPCGKQELDIKGARGMDQVIKSTHAHACALARAHVLKHTQLPVYGHKHQST